MRNVEIDIVLTYLLQLFHEKGILEHLAFKGGTMLRKMIFGPRGRLSTDLDFTLCSEIARDDLVLKLLEVFGAPYRGLTFQIDQSNDWYVAAESCGANPLCTREGNLTGVRIRLQISLREKPVLPVVAVPQIPQDYFALLDFEPVAVPSLAFEEILAEKIRAASQRSKIRDLHDLAESANRRFDRVLVRGIAVLKLWSQGDTLDYGALVRRIQDGVDYDIPDLTTLLRKDQRPELDKLIERVIEGYRFLADIGPLEQGLIRDTGIKARGDAERLCIELRKRVAVAEGC